MREAVLPPSLLDGMRKLGQQRGASVYMVLALQWAWTGRHPFIAGSLYGLSLWCVMYLIVLPLRWPSILQRVNMIGLGEQWFSHIVLVGIPMALLAARYRQPLLRKVAVAMDR